MLSLAGCPHITDWALDRIAAQFGHSLELLDLSGCVKVTAAGLSGLHPLKGLRELRVGSRQANSQYSAFEEAKAAMSLEEAIPGLTVHGVDWEGAEVETERRRRLLLHPNVVEDARGSHWLLDRDGEFHLLRSDALKDRPVVDDDDLPLFLSTASKDVPNLPLEELEILDELSEGRLRHSLVGSPSGLHRGADTEFLLEHKAKKAAHFQQPVHPFLFPKEHRKALPPPSEKTQPPLPPPSPDQPSLAAAAKS